MARPSRLEVRTQDGDTIVEALNQLASHRARVAIDDRAALDLHVRIAHHGDLGAMRLRLGGAGYAAAVDPLGFVFAGFVADGKIRVRMRGEEYPLARDDGWMFPTGSPYTGEFGHAELGTINLPIAYVADLAESATGLAATDLRFDGSLPVSAAMSRHWTATARYLSTQLTEDADLPPLVQDQLLRLAASALLATFPNTTMTARLPRDGRIAPAALRRAMALMDAHPERPLTVADVAAGAGVGCRALQTAFRRHLGTTPMAYLRRVRLEKVHLDLQAADPADGATVRDAALRWGFASPSRFAADYRQAFGQSPSRTLRT